MSEYGIAIGVSRERISPETLQSAAKEIGADYAVLRSGRSQAAIVAGSKEAAEVRLERLLVICGLERGEPIVT